MNNDRRHCLSEPLPVAPMSAQEYQSYHARSNERAGVADPNILAALVAPKVALDVPVVDAVADALTGTMEERRTTRQAPRRVTLNAINAELARRGYAERLVRGNGYFYFIEGDAHTWYTSSVLVSHLTDLSIDQWVEERNALATSKDNGNGFFSRRRP